MTPAETLASKKVRKPRNGCVNPQRKRVWNCRIRELRNKLGLSIHEVAKEISMTVAGLSEIERGANPQLSTARTLAEFYGKTTDELWPTRATIEPPCGVK
jgi:DNA-binding XRE family transcriptional regulator